MRGIQVTARTTGAILLLALCACYGSEPSGVDASADPRVARAQELARRFLIVDTHVDVPYRMRESIQDISQRTPDGDFDYPRAREGGLDVPFMSIYVPASYQESGGAKEFADELIDMVEGFETSWPDQFVVVRSVAEARQAFAEGKMGLALGMENGAPIEDDLDNVEHFHRRGIRYITLTHSKCNQICDSSYDEQRRWNGLSPFGKQVVAEMNRVGVMIDVSHVSDEAFFQIIDHTQAPVIASHSSCRHFTPEWERNMSDEMIRALAAAGGVIQINFGSDFISDAYRTTRQRHRDHVQQHLEQNEIDEDSDEAQEYRRQYFRDNPVPRADVGDVAAHIDHVVKLVGIDHVGLGSDFDGVGDSLPTGLADVSELPNLIAELLGLGYTDEQIEQICSGNLFRVWSEVERIAQEPRRGG